MPFVLYPAEVLFMNKAFSGSWVFAPDVTQAGHANWEISGTKVDILDPSHQLPVDLGIVFLPKSTPVQPETGSKYEIEEGKGVYHEARVEALQILLDSDTGERHYQILQTLDETTHSQQFRESQNQVAKLREEFWQIAGFDDDLSEDQKDRIENLLLSKWKPGWDRLEQEWQEGTKIDKIMIAGNLFPYLGRLGVDVKTFDDNVDEISFEQIKKAKLYSMMEEAHALYLPAKTTIPAQEFWENWFSENDCHPARVLYYDGDPNVAIASALKENGIVEDNDIDRRTGRLRFRDRKPIIPEQDVIDIANFKRHETGHWMMRVTQDIPNRD